jgi:hypothetical protein
MPTDSPSHDQPAGRAVGVSDARERLWGAIGGLVGSAIGVGSFLVAWLADRAPWKELSGAPYPPFLAARRMIALDYYLLGVVLLGMGFLGCALIGVRLGRFPRSDGYGATLIGAILCALGGVVLFLRVFAITH